MKSVDKNRKGFTVAELLIVMAIIGILVGVSVPIFATQMEKSREATDAANERDARAISLAAFLTDGTNGTFYYDSVSGSLKTTSEDIIIYGKGTTAGAIAEDHTECIIRCTITPSGTVTLSWRREGINSAAYIGDETPSLYLLDLYKKLKLSAYPIDSTCTYNGNTQQIVDALAEEFDDTNIGTWKIDKESSYLIVWISDVDISTAPVGSYVRVIRYNTRLVTYTAAYMKVVSRTYNGVTYNALAGGVDSSNYSQIEGQTNATKKSYESTVAVFNTANQIRS